MVRLRVEAVTIDIVRVSRFQFLNGTIKRAAPTAKPENVEWFQFLNGTIKRVRQLIENLP